MAMDAEEMAAMADAEEEAAERGGGGRLSQNGPYNGFGQVVMPALRLAGLLYMTAPVYFANARPLTHIFPTVELNTGARRGRTDQTASQAPAGGNSNLLLLPRRIERGEEFCYGVEIRRGPAKLETPEGKDAWIPGFDASEAFRAAPKEVPLKLRASRRQIQAFCEEEPLWEPFHHVVEGRRRAGYFYDGDYTIFQNPELAVEYWPVCMVETTQKERSTRRRLQRYSTERWAWFKIYLEAASGWRVDELTDAHKTALKMFASKKAARDYYPFSAHAEAKERYFRKSRQLERSRNAANAVYQANRNRPNLRRLREAQRRLSRAQEAWFVPWGMKTMFNFLDEIDRLIADNPTMTEKAWNLAPTADDPDHIEPGDSPYPKWIAFSPLAPEPKWVGDYDQDEVVHAIDGEDIKVDEYIKVPIWIWNQIDAEFPLPADHPAAWLKLDSRLDRQLAMMRQVENLFGLIKRVVVDPEFKYVYWERCLTQAVTVEELMDLARLVEYYIWSRKDRANLWMGMIDSSMVKTLIDNTWGGPVSVWPLEWLTRAPIVEWSDTEGQYCLKAWFPDRGPGLPAGKYYVTADQIQNYCETYWLTELEADFDYEPHEPTYAFASQKDDVGTETTIVPTMTARASVRNGEIASFFDSMRQHVDFIKNSVHGEAPSWNDIEEGNVKLKIITPGSLALIAENPDWPGELEIIYSDDPRFKFEFNNPRFDIKYRDKWWEYDPEDAAQIFSHGRWEYFWAQMRKLQDQTSPEEFKAKIQEMFWTPLREYDPTWIEGAAGFDGVQYGRPLYDPIEIETDASGRRVPILVPNRWMWILEQRQISSEIYLSQTEVGPALRHTVDGLKWTANMLMAEQSGTYVRPELFKTLRKHPWVPAYTGAPNALYDAVKEILRFADEERAQWAAYQAIRDFGWGNYNWSDKESIKDIQQGLGTIWTDPHYGQTDNIQLNHFFLGRYVVAAEFAKNMKEYLDVFGHAGFDEKLREKIEAKVQSGDFNWLQTLWVLQFFDQWSLLPADRLANWQGPDTGPIHEKMQEVVQAWFMNDAPLDQMYDKTVPYEVLRNNPNQERATELIFGAVLDKVIFTTPVMAGKGPYEHIHLPTIEEIEAIARGG